MMDLYIIDQEFNDVDIVNDAESIIWKKCYCDPGSFEIYTIASTKNVNLLQIGRFVARLDDDMVGVIEKINIQKDDDGEYMMLVSGRCAKSLFARRIIYPQRTFTGTVWNRMYWMLYYNAVNPAASNPDAENRQIPNITISDVDPGIKGISDKTQHTGTNLMDAVIELLAANDLGWKVTKDGSGFTVTLISGTDRTINQTENEPVVFADELNNLISTDYEKDMTGYANVAQVAGEGEGSSRIWAGIDLTGTASGIYSGLDRYESFVDARDLQKKTTNESGNETTLTDAEYIAQLQARGMESLKTTEYTESFEGEVDWGAYKYRVNYDVGDIVTIKNQYGISADIRIVAVEEIEDENGYTVTPILADCSSIMQNTQPSSGSSGTIVSGGSSSGGGVDLTYIENRVSTLESNVSVNTYNIQDLDNRVGALESNGGSGNADTQELLKMVYPVGAIYMSTSSTSPATLFGFGSWSRIQDAFLLGVGSSYATYSGKTGGEATHTLTESEMPAHKHGIYVYNASGSTSNVYAYKADGYVGGGIANTTAVGSGSAHNNMPPYYGVYIWRRTA